MKRILLAVAAVVIGGAVAEAGPLRRPVQRTTASACSGGSCATTRTVSRGGGAQAHAEAMAARGVLVHASSHPGFEGVGVGGSPASALAACCNNGGAVLEEGVARGRDGRWYACRRYSVR